LIGIIRQLPHEIDGTVVPLFEHWVRLDAMPASRAGDYQATDSNNRSDLDIFLLRNESLLDGSGRSCSGRQRALKQWGFDGM
jgi:hypothetical protein